LGAVSVLAGAALLLFAFFACFLECFLAFLVLAEAAWLSALPVEVVLEVSCAKAMALAKIEVIAIAKIFFTMSS